MATKLGIRNVTRNGNDISFLLVALNADGSTDTSFTGTVILFGANFQPIPAYAFTAGDQGMRSFSATATQDSVQIRAQVDGSPSIEVALTFHPPAGDTSAVSVAGDNYFVGNVGNDSFTGSTGNDIFLLHQGGADTGSGGGGNDGFYFGGAFGGGDSVNGGAGDNDQVAFQGSYNTATTLAASQFPGVEGFALLSVADTRFAPTMGESYDYNFELTGAWSGTITFNMNGLGEAEDATISAATTTGGAFNFFAGFGVEMLTGGGGNDGFYFGEGRFNPVSDVVNGLGGTDNQIGLRGNYTLNLTGAAIVNIQTIALISSQDARYGLSASPFTYNLTLGNGLIGTGNQLTVTGAGLIATEPLTVDGSGELTGALRLIGGAGEDVVAGGEGDDIIWGGLGSDSMSGNGGANRFVFTSTAESAGNFDFINGFTEADLIDLSAIDADVNMPGHQSFTFIGNAAFSGVAGQLRFEIIGGSFRIDVDTDGNGGADMAIGLVGPAGGYTVSADDFIGVI
jgi:Ca2+-binding RTX toxin-like protein